MSAPLVDFALTARVLRRSPRNLIDRVDEDGTWTRVVVLSRGPALLRGRQHGATLAFDAAPAAAGGRRAIEALVTRLFAFELDLAPFWRRVRRGLGRLDVFPAGDVGATRTLGRILGRVLDPPAAVQFVARFAPLRGMLYFCMLGHVLAEPGSGSRRYST